MLHHKIGSDGPAEPQEEAIPIEDRRRGSQRYVTVLKVGKAVVDGHDQLCLVRNMSREGAKLDIFHDVTKDQKITIELRSDKIVTGTVRWVGDHAAGIEFDEPVEVAAMLQGRPNRSVLRRLPRAPRFLANAKIEIKHDNGKAPGQLVNISLHGLCAEIEGRIRNDEKVIVSIEGLPSRSATVRWIHETMAGIHFDMPMGFSELARWLEDH